jgi:Transposase DDE domain
MAQVAALHRWTATVATQLPRLSHPQATVLAAWSFALVCTQSCGRTSAAVFLAALWDQSESTVRQRLREWTYEKEAKKGVRKGVHRQELEVRSCFAPLLFWVLTYWPATHARLALALDATLLGDRLTVLTCAVVYRGCAIPIAWKVVRATQKGAWKPHWLALLAELRDVLPASWTVLVLADRGLYARWLFRQIVANGWHPYLRLNRQGLFRVRGEAHWRELATLTPQPGTQWTGAITCFKGPQGQVDCTILARWEAEQKEPWLIVTDLEAEEAEGAWYGLRMWVEGGFKDLKRGGWHWEQTKMREPERVGRHWLVMAVATLWVVTVGGAAEAAGPVSGLEELPELHIARRLRKRGSQARLVSCFRRGVILIVAGLLKGEVPEVAGFWPEEWPRDRDRPPLEATQLASEAELAVAAERAVAVERATAPEPAAVAA